MKTGVITVVEGKGITRTVFSLQFVYKGSKVSGEYGCFLSGSKTLEEIRDVMDHYGMPSEDMKSSPSIVMLDVGNLEKINFQTSGEALHLETLLPIIEAIYNDIKFTRLVVDGFDLLSKNDAKKNIERFSNFARMNGINMLLTVEFDSGNADILELCDNFITIKRGYLPEILFS